MTDKSRRNLPKDIRYGEGDEWAAIIRQQDETGKAMNRLEEHLKYAAKDDLK